MEYCRALYLSLFLYAFFIHSPLSFFLVADVILTLINCRSNQQMKAHHLEMGISSARPSMVLQSTPQHPD